MYKQGKSFPDVEYAVCQGISSTILRGQGKFRGVIGGMAQNLEEVLEISDKTRREIRKAEEDFLAGRIHTIEEVKKKLRLK